MLTLMPMETFEAIRRLRGRPRALLAAGSLALMFLTVAAILIWWFTFGTSRPLSAQEAIDDACTDLSARQHYDAKSSPVIDFETEEPSWMYYEINPTGTRMLTYDGDGSQPINGQTPTHEHILIKGGTGAAGSSAHIATTPTHQTVYSRWMDSDGEWSNWRTKRTDFSGSGSGGGAAATSDTDELGQFCGYITGGNTNARYVKNETVNGVSTKKYSLVRDVDGDPATTWLGDLRIDYWIDGTGRIIKTMRAYDPSPSSDGRGFTLTFSNWGETNTIVAPNTTPAPTATPEPTSIPTLVPTPSIDISEITDTSALIVISNAPESAAFTWAQAPCAEIPAGEEEVQLLGLSPDEEYTATLYSDPSCQDRLDSVTFRTQVSAEPDATATPEGETP